LKGLWNWFLLPLLLLLGLCAGASAMLECLAFKATRHRDTLRVMKEVRHDDAP
jgi:hypothetical protein